MNSRSKTITTLAVLAALIFVAMTLDRTLTFFLAVSAAFLTLTVTFTFALMKPSLCSAAASGLIFGISSCITAIFFGKETFINPLISILPRAFIGLVALGVYRLMGLATRKMPERAGEALSLGAAAAMGALSNTVLTLSAMYLFGSGNTLQQLFTVMVFVNALPEFIVSAFAVPIVVTSVRKGLHIRPTDRVKAAAVTVTVPATVPKSVPSSAVSHEAVTENVTAGAEESAAMDKNLAASGKDEREQ